LLSQCNLSWRCHHQSHFYLVKFEESRLLDLFKTAVPACSNVLL
jgi:hypothetical protein